MKTLPRRPLSVETLEGRDLLAVWSAIVSFGGLWGDLNPPGGNVTAEVIDGKLVIRGDAKDNGVAIYSFGDGKYAVDTVNGRSLINGQVTVRQLMYSEREWTAPVFSNVTSIDVDLGDGDDFLSLRGMVQGDVSVRLGGGDDRAHSDDDASPPHQMFTTGWLRPPPGPAAIVGNLFIDAGAGDDILNMNANVSGNATVRMGSGNDNVQDVTVEDPYYGPRRYFLNVAGEYELDLGADETPPPAPSDWREDPKLEGRIAPFVLEAFERYRADLAAGRVLPGEEWTLQVPYDSPIVRIDGDGRMELEFHFQTGSAETLEPLLARGVQLDRYSSGHALAFVQLTEAELRYLAFLPGITDIMYRSPTWTTMPITWDYVREEPLTPPVTEPSPESSGPVEEPASEPAPSLPTAEPELKRTLRSPAFVYGPLPLPISSSDSTTDDGDESETQLAAASLSDETITLLAHYYANRPTGPKQYGPRVRGS